MEPAGLSISTAGPSNGNATQNNGTLPDHIDLEEAWRKQNLLSLDGGGIRGYWTLLVLEKLMEAIAEEEREYDDGQPAEWGQHSFAPLKFSDGVTHGVLNEAEQAARREGSTVVESYRDSRKYLPCHYFDFICGSSTGALIAIMLGRFRMPVHDCIVEYEEMGNQVFGHPRIFCQKHIYFGHRPKFSGKAMKKAIEEVSGRRCEYKDSDSAAGVIFAADSRTRNSICKTFVTAMRSETTSAGVTEKKLFLFRTYDHDKDPEGIPYRPRLRRQNTPDPNMIRRPTTINYGVAESLCVWQVARAATAAPFFFSTIKFQRHTLEGVRTEHFSDGGFGPQNNPTMEGIREIETMYGNGRVGAIVNVGTSRDPSLDGNGTMTRIKGTFDAATDPRIVADEVRRRQIAWRFNDDGGIGVAMDEWKPSGRFVKAPGRKTLGKIRIEFHRWASESANHKSISACARELVKRRRRRIEDKGRWEVFATGAFFGCGIAGCLDAPFPSAEDLREHYIRSHGFGDGEVDAVVERGTKKWRYQSNSHLHGT